MRIPSPLVLACLTMLTTSSLAKAEAVHQVDRAEYGVARNQIVQSLLDEVQD
jgi:hypothetical protein